MPRAPASTLPTSPATGVTTTEGEERVTGGIQAVPECKGKGQERRFQSRCRLLGRLARHQYQGQVAGSGLLSTVRGLGQPHWGISHHLLPCLDVSLHPCSQCPKGDSPVPLNPTHRHGLATYLAGAPTHGMSTHSPGHTLLHAHICSHSTHALTHTYLCTLTLAHAHIWTLRS